MCSSKYSYSFLNISGPNFFLPTAPPGMITAGPDPTNSERLLLSWEALTCDQLRAPRLSYIVVYGRVDGVNGVRRRPRRGPRARSNDNNDEIGLGFMDKGVEYFFMIAVQNVNGIGPFSDRVIGGIQIPGERCVYT